MKKEYADRELRESVESPGPYRGIARIPAARRWLRRKYLGALTRRDHRQARELRARMEQLGMVER